MSGHSHWAGIKRQKEVTDQKRGRVFSKLVRAITAAVGKEPNPDFNPRLRTAVQKAKEAKVPADNIERAITKAAEAGIDLEELIFEAYGPGGTAVLMEAITDNRNRTVAEIKKILVDHQGKWAETGSVRWTFEHDPTAPRDRWRAKFTQPLDTEEAAALRTLVEQLEDHDDIQDIFVNTT